MKNLARFPKTGRVIAEFPALPHRDLVIASRRYFYRVEDKVVWIIAVWHGAQAPKKLG